MKAEKVTGESSYARRQRRRAERIIAATGCYSATFRAEVKLALDRLPHKLPVLFREAERIDERLESAGRSIRASMRKAGCPVGEPRPLGRSPKSCVAREAEEIESVFLQYQADELNDEMAERAKLMSDILFELGNEARVDATHPQLVRAYYLAIRDAIDELGPRERDQIWVALNQISDLMNGCSEARFEEIDTYWNGENDEKYAARARALGEEYVPVRSAPAAPALPVESDQLIAAREKLAALEDVPENEAVAFRLETEIFNLEHALVDDEWPDEVGG